MRIVENKLERFTNDIMADVGKKRQQIIESVDMELTEKYDDKEIEYLTHAYNYIQTELKKIDLEKNEILSKTIMDSKKKLLMKREEIIRSTFNEAKEKLIQFTKSDKYIDYLISSIQAGIERVGEGEITVYIAPTDEDVLDELKSHFNPIEFSLESKKMDMIGGFKIINPSTNIFLDESFHTKLYEQKLYFLERCKLDIE